MPPLISGVTLKVGAAAVAAAYVGGQSVLGSSTIGGVPVGQVGGVGTIYEGYVLSDGDEFNSLDLVTAANPSGAYFTTRAYRGPGGSTPAPGLRAPATGPLAVAHDVSPDYTGWADANRGVALNLDSHTIVGGALRLKSIRQTAGEQVYLATGVAGQVERAAMINTAGRMWWNTPSILEFYATLPPGPAGQHPTLWALSMEPPGGSQTGGEYGFEGNGSVSEAYDGTWNAGTLTGVQHGGETAAWRDGLPHKFTVVSGPTHRKFYVDDVLVMTGYTDPDVLGGNKSDYALITNHIVNASWFGQTYSASEWAADADGVVMDIHWMRLWRAAAGKHYSPLVSIPDVMIQHGAATSIVLPSQLVLWGESGLTEYVCAVPNEVEEPGGSNSGSYEQFPTGVTYDAPSRTISIANTLTGSGCLHLVVGVSQDGCACKPARIKIFVAPRWLGANSFSWVSGNPVTTDIYALWDVGRLFRTTGTPKGITMTGLPSGASFSDVTGMLTGTVSGASSGTVTMTATNSAGQTTSIDLPYVVSATSDTAAPTLTGNPALVASWDFNDSPSLLVQDTNRITSASGVDGTSFTLSSAGTQRPIVHTSSGKNTARFLSSELRYLQVASGLGITSASTIVVVAEHFDNATTVCLADISVGNAAFSANRRMILASTTSGHQARMHDATNTQCVASQGSPYQNGKVLAIGVFDSGVNLNVNGAGTAVVGSPAVAQPSNPNKFTLGADSFTGGLERYANCNIFRVLVYGVALNATQREEIAVWAAAKYGTANNA